MKDEEEKISGKIENKETQKPSSKFYTDLTEEEQQDIPYICNYLPKNAPNSSLKILASNSREVSGGKPVFFTTGIHKPNIKKPSGKRRKSSTSIKTQTVNHLIKQK